MEVPLLAFTDQGDLGQGLPERRDEYTLDMVVRYCLIENLPSYLSSSMDNNEYAHWVSEALMCRGGNGEAATRDCGFGAQVLEAAKKK